MLINSLLIAIKHKGKIIADFPFINALLLLISTPLWQVFLFIKINLKPKF